MIFKKYFNIDTLLSDFLKKNDKEISSFHLMNIFWRLEDVYAERILRTIFYFISFFFL